MLIQFHLLPYVVLENTAKHVLSSAETSTFVLCFTLLYFTFSDNYTFVESCSCKVMYSPLPVSTKVVLYKITI